MQVGAQTQLMNTVEGKGTYSRFVPKVAVGGESGERSTQ